MNISLYRFKSNPPQTIFAPQWEYFIAETILSNIDFQNIAKFILKMEDKILKKFKSSNFTNEKGDLEITDGYTGLGPNSLTSRFANWNLLNYKQECSDIAKLSDVILDFHDEVLEKLEVTPEFYPKELWIQCWANVLRKGEKIEMHLHSVSPDVYLGGFVCVQTDIGETSTQTHYVCPANQINDPFTIDIDNIVGGMTLFQNCIPHYSDTYMGEKERITIAMDIKTSPQESKNFIKLR